MFSSIHQEVVLKASPDRIYNALMDPRQRTELTGAPAEVSRDPGGAFSAHGGFVTGRNVELVSSQRIVQTWRFGNWADGVHSIVHFELKAEGGGETRIILDHTGVPEDHRKHLEDGWNAQYWEKLRKYLG
jgi:uncharacterized protein YndB with AHSA1/START domain